MQKTREEHKSKEKMKNSVRKQKKKEEKNCYCYKYRETDLIGRREESFVHGFALGKGRGYKGIKGGLEKKKKGK